MKILQNDFYINCLDADDVEFQIRKFYFWQLKSIELFLIKYSFLFFYMQKRVKDLHFCQTLSC